jgi:predicted membrane channel-forming protein YqfA (hemolysin III family)
LQWSLLTTLASNLGSIITTFGVSIAAAGIVASAAARTWGRSTRTRQAIFGIVGTAGLILALVIA